MDFEGHKVSCMTPGVSSEEGLGRLLPRGLKAGPSMT